MGTIVSADALSTSCQTNPSLVIIPVDPVKWWIETVSTQTTEFRTEDTASHAKSSQSSSTSLRTSITSAPPVVSRGTMGSFRFESTGSVTLRTASRDVPVASSTFAVASSKAGELDGAVIASIAVAVFVAVTATVGVIFYLFRRRRRDYQSLAESGVLKRRHPSPSRPLITPIREDRFIASSTRESGFNTAFTPENSFLNPRSPPIPNERPFLEGGHFINSPPLLSAPPIPPKAAGRRSGMPEMMMRSRPYPIRPLPPVGLVELSAGPDTSISEYDGRIYLHHSDIPIGALKWLYPPDED